MKLKYSKHWQKKKSFRPEINDYLIEYAITNSQVQRDRYWNNAFNAICWMPQVGRILKVVFRRQR